MHRNMSCKMIFIQYKDQLRDEPGEIENRCPVPPYLNMELKLNITIFSMNA